MLANNIDYQIEAYVSQINGSLLFINLSDESDSFKYYVKDESINKILSELPQTVLKGDISRI